MKIVSSNNLTMVISAALVLFLSTSAVFAQPPDNAALSYYQAFLLYEKPDETTSKMLTDFRNGKIGANEAIEQYIEKNRQVLEFLIAAADTPNCDWGFDYSKGFELTMPNLAQLRRATYLIEAEAKLLAEKGDYKMALERCLSMHKMALHAADKTLVSYLVAIAISARANGAIQSILKETPEDSEILYRLKEQFIQIDDKFPLLKDCIVYEGQVCATAMQKEKVQAIMEISSDRVTSNPKMAERILSADDDFFKRNRDYWFKSIDTYKTTLESGLPYPQTCMKLGELGQKIIQEAEENPDATLTSISLPALGKIYDIAVRRKTHSNAVRAALEIYITKAKTGKLPDELPAALPGDLFSGKDFKYEKTRDGFVLHCQGKDLGKNKIYEYEFKVSK